MSNKAETVLKAPAKVLGCLRPGYLTIVVGHELGRADGGVPNEIPMDLVPFDLRMPNSEFTVVMDRTTPGFIAVERLGAGQGEGGPGAGGT